MDSDGTRDPRGGTRGRAVPGPSASLPPKPLAPPTVPPQAQHEANGPQPVAVWLDAPRPEAAPGIWRFGYVPPKPRVKKVKLEPRTIVGALVPVLIGSFLWNLWARGAFPYQNGLLRLLTPDDWWWTGTLSPKDGEGKAQIALALYNTSFRLLLLCAMAYLGGWPALIRHWVGRREQPARAGIAALGAGVGLLLVFPTFDSDPVPLYTTVAFAFQLADLVHPLVNGLIAALVALAVLWPAARWGQWVQLIRQRRAERNAEPRPVPVVEKPSHWPDLRKAGQTAAADALTAEVLSARMNDVDYARIRNAWSRMAREGRVAAFAETVLREGASAWTHPSGARDLPTRSTKHDLLVGQVRVGRWASGERTPDAYGEAGAALEVSALATSLLAVGPLGSGRTERLMAPAAEALALKALTGGCAVVAVGPAAAPLGPDGSYDVVVRPGDPDAVYRLDLYAGLGDPDQAAEVLTEALIGDIESIDTGRAAMAVAQLIGTFQAVHGRFPSVPELRELAEARPEQLRALLERLPEHEAPALRRDLEPWLRQSGVVAIAGPAIADRLALLDRPVLRNSFGPAAPGVAEADDPDTVPRPFPLQAIAHHPLRVRVDLPDHGHEQTVRLLARLVLAQFLAVARTGGRRDHFLGLVMDDATGAITRETVRAVQRLRSHNAGVVLGLRTLVDVPERLHGPLLSAVGCRAVFSGVSTWDGKAFAETWGTEWVETTEVAHHTVFADQPMTRALHALRKLVTGRAVTTEAVTVRKVERARWSASELAHAVPPGHAVLSLTDTDGRHAPPLLVDLRG